MADPENGGQEPQWVDGRRYAQGVDLARLSDISFSVQMSADVARQLSESLTRMAAVTQASTADVEQGIRMAMRYYTLPVEQFRGLHLNDWDAVKAMKRSEYEVASERAEGLLRSLLNERELRQLDAHEAFAVRGSEGGEFVVDNRYSTLYWRMSPLNRKKASDEHFTGLCIDAMSVEWLPVADNSIARKLWAETDESEVLRVANPTGYIWPHSHAADRVDRFKRYDAMVKELPPLTKPSRPWYKRPLEVFFR